MRSHSIDRFPRAASAPKRSVLSKSCDGLPLNEGKATDGQPRRPKTTPKPRVRRLLLGPGQTQSSEASTREDVSLETESFMTQLPPSPPRAKAITALDGQNDSDTDDQVPERKLQPVNVAEDDQAAMEEISSSRAAFHEDGDQSSQTEEHEQTIDQSDLFILSDRLDEGDDAEANTIGHKGQEEIRHERSGPQVIDVDLGATDSPSDKNSNQPEENIDSLDPATDTERLGLDEAWLRSELDRPSCESTQDDEEDEEYRRSLASRQQFKDEDVRRQVVRAELQGYVTSLTTRKDESGDAFVTFPKNYDQVVSLMTAQDVRNEVVDPGSSSHQSWSHVLIQNALLKQNAYGVVDARDEQDSKDGLAAKIALKIARIRQLDAVLEEKLGKNWYSVAGKKTSNPNECDRPKTFVTQPQSSVAKDSLQESSSAALREVSRSSSRRSGKNNGSSIAALKGKTNFVERNRQVVESGMRANLTRDEEERLQQLLVEAASDMNNAVRTDSADSQDVNVFALAVDEKLEIEQLLSVKRDDDLSFLAGPMAETNQRETGNMIQANRLRLERIDQELRLLQESQSIEIQADADEDDEGSVIDDCQSEISYKTSVSMASTCSTRSGMISRREFSRFVAAEVARNSQKDAKASTGAIQGLLSSFPHLFVRSEAAMAT